ncbi:MAG: endonuclease, partial [Tannerella sp.]|nr:endonuclease [Tannerella sp.]
MKPSHNWINSFVAVLNIIVAILFIVASFSDTVSPAKSLFFAYLGILFPFFFALNFCFLVYWLIVRKWMLLFIAFCSFLICWKPVTHYLPFHPHKEEVSTEKSLKVLTYNVMCFGYKDHTEKKPNQIVRYIQNSEADIVCMQEFMVRTAEGSN